MRISSRVALVAGLIAAACVAACSSSAKIKGRGTVPRGIAPASSGAAASSASAGGGSDVQIDPGVQSSAACKLLTVGEIESATKLKVAEIGVLQAPGKFSDQADICHWIVGDPNLSDSKAVLVSLEKNIDLGAAKNEFATNGDSGIGTRVKGLGDDAIDYGGPIDILKGTAWLRVDVEVGDLKVDDTGSAALAPLAVGRL